jgi:hypothetical protein
VSGIDYDTRAPQQVSAARVFLAAGPVASARILLESMNLFDHPVTMSTSQHFMFPWIQQNATERLTGSLRTW